MADWMQYGRLQGILSSNACRSLGHLSKRGWFLTTILFLRNMLAPISVLELSLCLIPTALLTFHIRTTQWGVSFKRIEATLESDQNKLQQKLDESHTILTKIMESRNEILASIKNFESQHEELEKQITVLASGTASAATVRLLDLRNRLDCLGVDLNTERAHLHRVEEQYEKETQARRI